MDIGQTRFIIVMGVSSSGKSTMGAAIAHALDAPFLDGDDFHPPANKEKMANSIPLTDEDRWPWLASLCQEMQLARILNAMGANNEDATLCVAACSALKKSYRTFMQEHLDQQALFVFLNGSKELILSRMQQREHEYMPTSLLDSQFTTLETPEADEKVMVVDIADDPQTIVAQVKARFAN